MTIGSTGGSAPSPSSSLLAISLWYSSAVYASIRSTVVWNSSSSTRYNHRSPRKRTFHTSSPW